MQRALGPSQKFLLPYGQAYHRRQCSWTAPPPRCTKSHTVTCNEFQEDDRGDFVALRTPHDAVAMQAPAAFEE